MKDALNALHLKEDLENALPVLSTSVVHKWKDLLQLEAIKVCFYHILLFICQQTRGRTRK